MPTLPRSRSVAPPPSRDRRARVRLLAAASASLGPPRAPLASRASRPPHPAARAPRPRCSPVAVRGRGRLPRLPPASARARPVPVRCPYLGRSKPT